MGDAEQMPEWLCRILLEKQATLPAEKFQDLQRAVLDVARDSIRERSGFGELSEDEQRVEIDCRLKDCRSVAGRLVYLFAKLFPGESEVLKNEARYMLAGHLEIKHGVSRSEFDNMTQLQIVQLLEAASCIRESSPPQDRKSDFKLPQFAQEREEKKVDYADRWLRDFLKRNPAAYISKVSDERLAKLAGVSKGTMQKTATRVKYLQRLSGKPSARTLGGDVLAQHKHGESVLEEILTEEQRRQELMALTSEQEAEERADAHYLPNHRRRGQRPVV